MQEPAARQLYNSLSRFTDLQDYLQVWPGHGAGSSCGKALGAVPTTTVGYERMYNASLGVANSGEDAFVDAILSGQPEPPLYFARMKKANKVGPRLLGALPRPEKLSAAEFARTVSESRSLVVDTRLDRVAYMARHVPGSQYAPLNKSFNTVVGSLVEDETQAITLIVDDRDVERAVRDLIRIGYDNIVSYTDIATLEAYFEGGGASSSVEVIDFEDVARLIQDEEYAVVDTRYLSEYESGHVPGAINASYTRLAEHVEDRMPEGKTLLVHCQGGGRAAPASSYLSRRGYDVKFVNDAVAKFKAATSPAGKDAVRI
jgi:hydroxyacylglutathione hydrolase